MEILQILTNPLSPLITLKEKSHSRTEATKYIPQGGETLDNEY